MIRRPTASSARQLFEDLGVLVPVEDHTGGIDGDDRLARGVEEERLERVRFVRRRSRAVSERASRATASSVFVRVVEGIGERGQGLVVDLGISTRRPRRGSPSPPYLASLTPSSPQSRPPGPSDDRSADRSRTVVNGC